MSCSWARKTGFTSLAWPRRLAFLQQKNLSHSVYALCSFRLKCNNIWKITVGSVCKGACSTHVVHISITRRLLAGATSTNLYSSLTSTHCITVCAILPSMSLGHSLEVDHSEQSAACFEKFNVPPNHILQWQTLLVWRTASIILFVKLSH